MKVIDKDAVLSIIDNAMAEEMKLFETALKDGDADVSGSPVAYTRLQILRSSIDRLEVKEVNLQEEPVSSIWHDASKEIPTQGSNILMVRKEEEDTNYPPIAGCFHGTNSRFDGRNWGYYNGFCYNEIEPPVKWAYIDDILKLPNVQRTVKNCKEPVSEDLEEAANNALNNVLNAHEIVNVRSCLEMFKSGAKWQKKRDYIPLSDDINEVARQICNKVLNCEIDYKEDDVVLSDEEECVKAGIRWQMQKESIPSKDLEELINNLSKRYPEVSFAKLSRIAVRVAKWKVENLWKTADGDDLPEYEREVVVFTQIFPDDTEMMAVAIGHRPNPDGWDGKSIATGEVEHYTPKTYDKGGWNIPDVRFWLDVKLPKEIEL